MSVMQLMQRLMTEFGPFPNTDDRAKFGEELNRRTKVLEDRLVPQTALPSIRGDLEMVSRLHEHRDQLVAIKFWKRGCIPCLATAEMYKKAEAFHGITQMMPDGTRKPGVVFYSVDVKDDTNADAQDYHMVEGTPALLKFWNGKQVGGDVQISQLDPLLANLRDTFEKCRRGRCPDNIRPEEDPALK
eukprot:Hpha_TRINITY_DN30274_c0_g1::TRINITY_DN30274_c0_g1_i1::g.27172::m.27172